MIPNDIKLKAVCVGGMLLLLSTQAEAQFKAGSSFHVAPGTPIVIDSLTLQPATVSTDMSNTTLTVSHIPVPPAGAGSGSIARVYEFDPAITFRGVAGLYYLNSELNGNTPSSLSFVYENGNGNFNTNTLVTTNNVNNYVVATTGVNTVTLKRITAVDAGVPLPVDLLSFTAKAEGSRTLIEWTTFQEFNCDHFDVERSTDGSTFHFLTAENATGKPGTVPNNYKTYDVQPFQGWNYYRLKEVDADGRFSFSPTAAVFFGNEGTSVSVYPNPVQNRLSIAMNSKQGESSTLVLTDAAGRLLKSQKLELSKGDNIFNLDMNDLASGNYLLQIGHAFQTKVVKLK